MLALFDSGVGGLTVLRAVRTLLPHHRIVYLGDHAHMPYGDRRRSDLTCRVQQCCEFLFDRGAVLIVLACNTASADTLRELQQRWLPSFVPCASSPVPNAPRNVLGVIRPIAEEAVLRTRSSCIGVVGTRATVSSHAYERELMKLKPGIKVVQQPCPLLVPLIEEGWSEKPETRRILRQYLRPLKTHNPDVLLLGCTHYELLHGVFQRMMGRRCSVLHSPPIIARKLVEYLQRHPEYDREIARTGETLFLTTGSPALFRSIGERFLEGKMEVVEEVQIPQTP